MGDIDETNGEDAWAEHDAVVLAGEGNYSERPSERCKHCGVLIVLEDGYWFHELGIGARRQRCQPPAPYGTDAEPPEDWSIHGRATKVLLNGHPVYDSATQEWRTRELFFWPDGVVTWKPTR